MNKKGVMKMIVFSVAVIVLFGVIVYTQDRGQRKQEQASFSMAIVDQGRFEKETTPINNMLIILKILNGSSFQQIDQHDNAWSTELQECIDMLDKQVQINEKQEDTQVIEFMKLQKDLVKHLRSLKADPTIQTVDQLQETYDLYHDYYYGLQQVQGVNTHES